MDIFRLNLLRDKIQSLEKFHQIKVFELLHKNKIPFTENSNGIFVNLIKVPEKVICKIEEYLLYVSEQDSELRTTEIIKESLRAKHFKDKDNKDKPISINTVI